MTYAEISQALQRVRYHALGPLQPVNIQLLDAIALDGTQLAAALHEAARRQDWLNFEILVMKVQRQPSAACTPILSEILAMQREQNVNNENIIEALGTIGDPAAVPVLIETLAWHRDYDEFGSQEAKCIEALAKIATPEAMATIHAESNNALPKVKEATRRALAQLNHK